jgi:MoaA/NifB/PqqE/SkfB family radical SAM enzyme
VIDQTVNPTAIRVEAASHCQLRCPSCPTTVGATHPAIGGGFLRARDFARLLEQNPQVREVELSNYGEIFLNPELSEILRIGHERGITLTAQNGANLNSVRAGVIEDLVRYRFHSITCSIDGATQEIYGRYRVRGNLARVLDNIRAINVLKRRYRSPYPFLRWQFVVFGHNEHEIPAARRLAASLKMDFSPKLTWDDEFSPIRDRDFVRRETGLDSATRGEYRRKSGEDYSIGICAMLWNNPQINWDGKVLGCTRNFWGDFGGNAFTDGLRAAVNAEPMRYARAMLTGRAPARDDIPCTTCEIFLDMRKRGRWLGANPGPALEPVEALARAATCLAAGRLIDAEEIYLRVLSLQPQQPEALLGMAVLRHGLGWNEAAIAFAEAAMAAAPGDRRPRDLLEVVRREETVTTPMALETIAS